jgi:NAD-specific glutamate dehydrogenase
VDITQLAHETGQDLSEVASSYFAVGTWFGLLTLRREARTMPASSHWQSLAADALIDDSYASQMPTIHRWSKSLVNYSMHGEVLCIAWG